MSLFSGSNISELFVGESKIGSVFVGENCVYQSNYEIPIEEDNGDEYFYFRVHDKRETAQVGFERALTALKTGGTTEPTVNWSSFTTYVAPTFEYSYDKNTWNSYTLGTPLSIGKGQVSNKVYFRGDNLDPWYDSYEQTITESSTNSSGNSTTNDYTHTFKVWTHATIQGARVQCNGNIMSLRYKNFTDKLSLPCTHTFSALFSNCGFLLKAPVLSATNLASYCYNHMFNQCSNLRTPPILSATNLADHCYASMFYDSGITVPPLLPATTLQPYCYGRGKNPYYRDEDYSTKYSVDGMFASCYSLKVAPVLPATTLATGCYMCMFCYSGITAAPVLPATTLQPYCYANMFSSCSFSEPPILPATTLKEYCYAGMFRYSQITTAPKLPATALAPYCYSTMFYGSSITVSPTLPATTLKEYCYEYMFAYSSLIAAPALSATTLTSHCYAFMFYSCSHLTTPSALPATTLKEYCYDYMYGACPALTKIPKLPATTLADYCYEGMFSDIKASATSVSGCSNVYRIPTSGTGSGGTKSLNLMFDLMSDSSKSYTPDINTNFYISVPSF